MLNLGETSDRGPLRDDAQLAEELAVRYSDAVRRFQPESLTEVRGRRRQCLETLFGMVATIHGVSRADVERASLLRDVRVDIGAVFLPMAFLFGAVAMYIWKRFHDHLSGPHGRLAYGALLLGSIAASAAAVLGGELWSDIIEMIRVGNQHMSMRGNRTPWVHHRASIFAGGILLFWAVGILRLRIATRRFGLDRHEA